MSREDHMVYERMRSERKRWEERDAANRKDLDKLRRDIRALRNLDESKKRK